MQLAGTACFSQLLSKMSNLAKAIEILGFTELASSPLPLLVENALKSSTLRSNTIQHKCTELQVSQKDGGTPGQYDSTLWQPMLITGESSLWITGGTGFSVTAFGTPKLLISHRTTVDQHS